MNSITMKNKTDKIYLGSYEGKVSLKIKERTDDPYLNKKTEEAWETLRRVGLPHELVKIREERMKI
ncbi:hypothetical protein [Pedobacter nyackensis]|uniref:hypothetical protein n=1 Tax=Pedobacter nyackensis TaxID=475255 RepID=UPI00292F44AC|nr:hypothetical protein [Pedobacter nyackensis]